MRKAVEGDHPTVVYELEVMIRWVEERRRMGEELKKKKKIPIQNVTVFQDIPAQGKHHEYSSLSPFKILAAPQLFPV